MESPALGTQDESSLGNRRITHSSLGDLPTFEGHRLKEHLDLSEDRGLGMKQLDLTLVSLLPGLEAFVEKMRDRHDVKISRRMTIVAPSRDIVARVHAARQGYSIWGVDAALRSKELKHQYQLPRYELDKDPELKKHVIRILKHLIPGELGDPRTLLEYSENPFHSESEAYLAELNAERELIQADPEEWFRQLYKEVTQAANKLIETETVEDFIRVLTGTDLDDLAPKNSWEAHAPRTSIRGNGIAPHIRAHLPLVCIEELERTLDGAPILKLKGSPSLEENPEGLEGPALMAWLDLEIQKLYAEKSFVFDEQHKRIKANQSWLAETQDRLMSLAGGDFCPESAPASPTITPDGTHPIKTIRLGIHELAQARLRSIADITDSVELNFQNYVFPKSCATRRFLSRFLDTDHTSLSNPLDAYTRFTPESCDIITLSGGTRPYSILPTLLDQLIQLEGVTAYVRHFSSNVGQKNFKGELSFLRTILKCTITDAQLRSIENYLSGLDDYEPDHIEEIVISALRNRSLSKYKQQKSSYTDEFGRQIEGTTYTKYPQGHVFLLAEGMDPASASLLEKCKAYAEVFFCDANAQKPEDEADTPTPLKSAIYRRLFQGEVDILAQVDAQRANLDMQTTHCSFSAEYVRDEIECLLGRYCNLAQGLLADLRYEPIFHFIPKSDQLTLESNPVTGGSFSSEQKRLLFGDSNYDPDKAKSETDTQFLGAVELTGLGEEEVAQILFREETLNTLVDHQRKRFGNTGHDRPKQVCSVIQVPSAFSGHSLRSFLEYLVPPQCGGDYSVQSLTKVGLETAMGISSQELNTLHELLCVNPPYTQKHTELLAHILNQYKAFDLPHCAAELVLIYDVYDPACLFTQNVIQCVLAEEASDSSAILCLSAYPKQEELLATRFRSAMNEWVGVCEQVWKLQRTPVTSKRIENVKCDIETLNTAKKRRLRNAHAILLDLVEVGRPQYVEAFLKEVFTDFEKIWSQKTQEDGYEATPLMEELETYQMTNLYTLDIDFDEQYVSGSTVKMYDMLQANDTVTICDEHSSGGSWRQISFSKLEPHHEILLEDESFISVARLNPKTAIRVGGKISVIEQKESELEAFFSMMMKPMILQGRKAIAAGRKPEAAFSYSCINHLHRAALAWLGGSVPFEKDAGTAKRYINFVNEIAGQADRMLLFILEFNSFGGKAGLGSRVDFLDKDRLKRRLTRHMKAQAATADCHHSPLYRYGEALLEYPFPSVQQDSERTGEELEVEELGGKIIATNELLFGSTRDNDAVDKFLARMRMRHLRDETAFKPEKNNSLNGVIGRIPINIALADFAHYVPQIALEAAVKRSDKLRAGSVEMGTNDRLVRHLESVVLNAAAMSPEPELSLYAAHIKMGHYERDVMRSREEAIRRYQLAADALRNREGSEKLLNRVRFLKNEADTGRSYRYLSELFQISQGVPLDLNRLEEAADTALRAIQKQIFVIHACLEEDPDPAEYAVTLVDFLLIQEIMTEIIDEARLDSENMIGQIDEVVEDGHTHNTSRFYADSLEEAMSRCEDIILRDYERADRSAFNDLPQAIAARNRMPYSRYATSIDRVLAFFQRKNFEHRFIQEETEVVERLSSHGRIQAPNLAEIDYRPQVAEPLTENVVLGDNNGNSETDENDDDSDGNTFSFSLEHWDQ